jgi:hypothetical protein
MYFKYIENIKKFQSFNFIKKIIPFHLLMVFKQVSQSKLDFMPTSL